MVDPFECCFDKYICDTLLFAVTPCMTELAAGRASCLERLVSTGEPVTPFWGVSFHLSGDGLHVSHIRHVILGITTYWRVPGQHSVHLWPSQLRCWTGRSGNYFSASASGVVHPINYRSLPRPLKKTQVRTSMFSH